MRTITITPSRPIKLERGTLEAGRRYTAYDHGENVSLAVYHNDNYIGLLDREEVLGCHSNTRMPQWSC